MHAAETFEKPKSLQTNDKPITAKDGLLTSPEALAIFQKITNDVTSNKTNQTGLPNLEIPEGTNPTKPKSDQGDAKNMAHDIPFPNVGDHNRADDENSSPLKENVLPYTFGPFDPKKKSSLLQS